MASSKRLLVVGAHPDDAEYHVGGLATIWVERGGEVKFLSVTDGSAGHQSQFGPALAERRRKESAAAAAVIGIAWEVWDVPDARLEPTLALRERLIRAVRAFDPDLVLTHRPNDFHPDHRYTSILVQDAAYLLTVPSILPDSPIPSRTPWIGYLYDGFQKPNPFRADVAIDVEHVLGRKLEMIFAHESQFLEWLPYNMGDALVRSAPPDAVRDWARQFVLKHLEEVAGRCREALARRYGARRAREIRFAEACEACEYGAPWTEDAIAELFGP